MQLCNETITVFNKRIDVEQGWDVFVPTVIKGVSWWGDVAVNISDKGLNAANKYTIRIPVDADFGSKTYVDPVAYGNEPIIAGYFTFANGDIIVKAEITDSGLTPAQIKENYPDVCTILGVTDNRRAPKAPHWRVTGA
jgi:hypothetical protein